MGTAFDVVGIGDGQTSILDEIRFGATYEDVIPLNWTSPTVDTGVDMITWSGQPVQLAPTVVNNQPGKDLTYAWSANPLDGVQFSATDIEDPTVTITKTTENPSVVTLTLSVNNSGEPAGHAAQDTLTIDVYDDQCIATISFEPNLLDATDLNEDCVTDFWDLIIMAQTWLVDYTATEPIAK